MAISLDLAISAIRAGRREEGRQLLNVLIQQNPNDDKAWLWMSSVVESEEQRARCLYHVLAIDPDNALARKGLDRLGIVVSDSRPVKIPRDSQPIRVAKPRLASRQNPPQLPPPQSRPQPQPQPAAPPSPVPAQRRPFLVTPENITKDLPFTPVQAQKSLVKASPSILSIDVEAVPIDKPEAKANEGVKHSPDGAAAAKNEPTETAEAKANSKGFSPSRYTETQKLVEPDWVKSMNSGSKDQSSPKAAEAESAKKSKSSLESIKEAGKKKPLKGKHPQVSPSKPANSNGQRQKSQQFQPQPDDSAFGPYMPNKDTRPSQPVPVTPRPHQNMPPTSGPVPPQYPGHSQVTMGMPYQQQQQYPMPPHSQMTMGMPMSPYGDAGRPPSEPVPAIHSNSTMGMVPYPYPQSPHNVGFHSNITTMMPTMSESEARARLVGTHPIPATDASAMALHAGMGYGFAGPTRMEPDYDDDDDNDEINILAVIIFGTLSVTALGGFGMLILLLFTAPPV
ncbi:MAG: hypothetical protein KDJ65_11550 [Anaerolineae bacterium]|nr:hypothetical protein [Anaerolineae bacterium]